MSEIWDSLFENEVPVQDPDRNVSQGSLCVTVITSPPGLAAGQCAVGDTRHAYSLAHTSSQQQVLTQRGRQAKPC